MIRRLVELGTDKRKLVILLDKIVERELALPDFQRKFVWEPSKTLALLVSILSGYPAGSVLIHDGGSALFKPRAFELAEPLNGVVPKQLVLDGQQRLTSLHVAIRGLGSHRYFLNVRELLDGADLDEALEVYPERKTRRWATIDGQANDLMLPLGRLVSADAWSIEVAAHLHKEDLAARLGFQEELRAVTIPIADILKTYELPTVTLGASTPAEAVCTIFETLNSTGVKLSVFELLIARGFAQGIDLRSMWDQAQIDRPILAEFGVDPYYVLQVLALRLGRPATRTAVLALSPRTIADAWAEAVKGVAGALRLLRSECGVLVPKWLGYFTLLLPLGAVHADLPAGPQGTEAVRRQQLIRWYWCAAFSGRYDSAINSRAQQDVGRLQTWFAGGEEPETVASFKFEPDMWYQTTSSQRALYQTTMALILRSSPLDFHAGSRLDAAKIGELQVDDHHLFPRGWLADNGLGGVPDSVLNHTLIDQLTNIRIGKRAPSSYLAEMEKEQGSDLFNRILSSHLLPPADERPLRQDQFEGFLAWRRNALAERLTMVTGP